MQRLNAAVCFFFFIYSTVNDVGRDGKVRTQKILDIFNDVQHLFRASTTGGHAAVELPLGWPSETWTTKIFGN